MCVGEKSEAMRGKMVCLAEEKKLADKISILENVGNPVCLAPEVMGEVVCSSPMRGEVVCSAPKI